MLYITWHLAQDVQFLPFTPYGYDITQNDICGVADSSRTVRRRKYATFPRRSVINVTHNTKQKHA
jgi:hypothetical protein